MHKFEVARECVSYDPATGEIRWLVKSGNAAKGSVVRRTSQDGYVRFNVRRNEIQGHQLAWWMHHGEVPAGMVVDHKNGQRTDNRLDKLRLPTVQENTHNRHRARGISGLLGVSWQPQSSQARPWKASICSSGKVTNLGQYADKFEAHAVYVEAKKRLHPSWAGVQP